MSEEKHRASQEPRTAAGRALHNAEMFDLTNDEDRRRLALAIEAEAATANEQAPEAVRLHEPEPSLFTEPARWDCSCGWHQSPATAQDWWTHVLATLSRPEASDSG